MILTSECGAPRKHVGCCYLWQAVLWDGPPFGLVCRMARCCTPCILRFVVGLLIRFILLRWQLMVWYAYLRKTTNIHKHPVTEVSPPPRH